MPVRVCLYSLAVWTGGGISEVWRGQNLYCTEVILSARGSLERQVPSGIIVCGVCLLLIDFVLDHISTRSISDVWYTLPKSRRTEVQKSRNPQRNKNNIARHAKARHEQYVKCWGEAACVALLRRG